MIWLALVLILLLVLFILILTTKITISINYYHHNDNDDLKIELKAWYGLIKRKFHIPLIKIDEDSPSIVIKSHQQNEDASEEKNHKVHQITRKDLIQRLKMTKEIIEKVVGMHVIIRKFLNKVTIKQFEWHSLIGLGDAAHTGTFTGALWTVKGSLLGLVSHYVKMKKMPEVSITPHFQLATVQTQLKCMIQFRIGHAMLAGIKLFIFWRGGRPRFMSKSNFSKEKTKSV